MKFTLLIVGIIVVLLVAALLLVMAHASYLKGKVAKLEKTLAGIDDPMVWLSDEDRRTHAQELLERERIRYQDDLLKQQLDQADLFNPTTQKKESQQ